MTVTARLAGALAGVALLLPCLPGTAAAATGCAGVKGGDIAPAVALKVVRRGDGRYVGCGVGAPFPPRRLPSPTTGERLTILDTAGGILAYRGARSNAVTVFDLRRGAGRTLVLGGRAPMGRVVVDATGAAMALYGAGTTARTLVGYDTDGRSYVADRGRIPTIALRHDGTRVRWTNGGRTKRADLRTPDLPCDRVAGREVVRTGSVRVVEVVYADEFLSGSLDGRTALKRACTRPGGDVRLLGSDTAASGGVQGGSALDAVATAGTSVVVLDRAASSGEEVVTAQLRRVDLASGRTTKLWGNRDAGGPRSALGDLAADPPVVVLTASGRTATVFERSTGGPARDVVVFAPDGTPRVLDSAPPADIDPRSLRLDGSVLTWTHSGTARTADLDAP